MLQIWESEFINPNTHPSIKISNHLISLAFITSNDMQRNCYKQSQWEKEQSNDMQNPEYKHNYASYLLNLETTLPLTIHTSPNIGTIVLLVNVDLRIMQ